MKHVVKSLYVEIKRDEYEALRARVAELEAKQPATPANHWSGDGEEDPHVNRYDCERAALVMGDLTDDELANAVFMHGNEMPDFQRVLAGTAKMPIVYLTAAKDRIRWLSRALAGATANHNEQSLNMVPDGMQPSIDKIAQFVEVVRECERLASSYCGTIDGVEEHGGDDHEDPTCAIWHRLYYAMFDGDRVIAELRQIAAPSALQSNGGCQ